MGTKIMEPVELDLSDIMSEFDHDDKTPVTWTLEDQALYVGLSVDQLRNLFREETK